MIIFVARNERIFVTKKILDNFGFNLTRCSIAEHEWQK